MDISRDRSVLCILYMCTFKNYDSESCLFEVNFHIAKEGLNEMVILDEKKAKVCQQKKKTALPSAKRKTSITSLLSDPFLPTNNFHTVPYRAGRYADISCKII